MQGISSSDAAHLSKGGRYRILHPVLWVWMFCGFAYRNVKMRRVSGYAVLKKARARGKLVEEMKLFR